MTGLTAKQTACLRFIADYLRRTGGTSPSYQEMMGALGLHSKSGVHRLVTGLEERGCIRRHAYRTRCIEIVRLPGDPREAVVSLARELLGAAANGFAHIPADLATRLVAALSEVSE